MKIPPVGPNISASAKARAFAAPCDEIGEVSRQITEVFGELIGILSESTVSDVVTGA